MKAGYTSSKKRRKERRVQQQKQIKELRQLIPWGPGDMDVSWLRELLTESLEGFAAEAGWRLALLLLEDEVSRRCGPRYSRPEEREVTRYGSQPGVVMIAGQKQSVMRPRLRGVDGGSEVPLETYALLQRPNAMPSSTLAKMVHGVSCRSYEQVVETARAGFGVAKSSVSRGFVKASAAELEKLMSRPLNTTRFVALFLDGISFAGEMLIVALGLDETGHKHILGLRQGDSENAVVCTDLVTELRDRGLDTSQPILAVLDGAKALASAVKKVWGDRVLIQRCQVHKKRNVKEYLAKTHHAELDRRLNAAYHGDDYETSLKQLHGTQKWLRGINPDAASSLGEGLEETLTVLKLGLSKTLRQSLSSTNVIESALDTARTVTRRVKKWRDGSMKKRWCAAGLRKVEQNFRRIKGYADLNELTAALEELVPKPSTPKTQPRSKST